MKMLPFPPPLDLTIPEPGSTTARSALSYAIRRTMQGLMRLTAASDPELRAFKPTLKRLLAESPGAVASVVRTPTVGALVHCLLRHAPELDYSSGVAELLATIYTDLAFLGALSEPVTQRRLPKRIISLPARRSIDIPSSTERVEFRNGEVVLIGGDGQGSTTIRLDQPPEPGEGEPCFTPITKSMVLACIDNNPLAMSEAHPDKAGNSIDLGGRAATEWTGVLSAGLELVGRYMPELRDEIDLFMYQIVPVGYDPQQHLSASYQEAVGTIYMTLHPQHMTMVEATIHEFQHNKLNALLSIDPLLHNAFHPLVKSPVRPDPRPLHGVVLAVHAFYPIARLYQLMREAGHEGTDQANFEARYAQILEVNREGTKVLLEHGKPTKIGQGLFEEFRRWQAHDWS